jgi:hypothetical protein
MDNKVYNMRHYFPLIYRFSLGLTLFLLSGAQTCSPEPPEQITLPDFITDYEVKADFSRDSIREF